MNQYLPPPKRIRTLSPQTLGTVLTTTTHQTPHTHLQNIGRDNSHKVSVRHDLTLTSDHTESFFVEIKHKSGNILAGIIYHRPKTSFPAFFDSLSSIVTKITSENKKSYIVGDFNTNLLAKDMPAARNLTNLFHENMFYNCITKPTRVIKSSATLIDHIWTNNLENNKNNVIIYSRVSDHFPVYSQFKGKLNYNNTMVNSVNIMYRDYSEQNMSAFTEAISNTEWAPVYSSTNPNCKCEKFLTIFTESFNRYFPEKSKQLKTKAIAKPYITTEIKNLIKEKHKLQRKYAKYPITYGDAFRNIRNQVTTAIRNAKSNYYKNKLKENSGNSRKTWQVLNTILNRHPNELSNDFTINDEQISDPSVIANGFNNHFSNVAKNLIGNITSPGNFLTYLGDPVPNNMTPKEITVRELVDVIKSMNNTTAGHDGIPAHIIKKVALLIAPVLVDIFNASLISGIFPNLLKVAKIVPIFKSGDKCDIKNYRPISLLTFFSKLLEKLMLLRLEEHCTHNNIITASQYGFMKGKSVESALLNFTNSVLASFDQKHFTLGIFLDLSKAFDTVDHSILLQKLDHYGIRYQMNDWFKSYLTNRTQFVSFKKCNSSITQILFGVPQGSILGPFLFLIFINDFVHCSSNIKFTLFADDTNIHLAGPDIKSLIETANNELGHVHNWLMCNRLTLNFEKSHYIIFKRNKRMPNTLPHLKIQNKIINREYSTKFLGVHIDHGLTWKIHMQETLNKISKCGGIITQVRHCLTREALKQLYYSLVYPHLMYCNTVWGGVGSQCSKKLFTSQKKIIRKIHFLKKYDHTNAAYVSLNVLKYNEIKDYCSAVYVYKMLGNPNNDMFIQRMNGHYMLRNATLLQTPQVRTNQSQSHIRFRGVHVWNSLPEDIRLKPSISSFKSSLKNYFLKRYSNH